MTEKTNEAAQVIGARLKECRHAKQWTINELAKELERVSGRAVSAATVGNWECGLRVPIEDMPPALAKVFNMPADYFERPPLLVDANPLKQYLRQVEAARTAQRAVFEEWRKLSEAEQLGQWEQFSARMDAAERDYYRACERVAEELAAAVAVSG